MFSRVLQFWFTLTSESWVLIQIDVKYVEVVKIDFGSSPKKNKKIQVILLTNAIVMNESSKYIKD